MNPAAEMERLAGLYREMLSLAQAGLGVLGAGDLEAWEDLWARRRQVQRQARAACLGLRPFMAAWEATLADVAAADPARAARLIALAAELRREGGRILELDRQARQALQGQLDASREGLKRLGQGERLHRAYHQAFRPGTQPLQLSRTG